MSQISSAATDTDGASNYAVSEKSVSVDASVLETSGLIKSWSYVSTDDEQADGLTVTISVTMPTYGDSLNRRLPTVVIVDPVVGDVYTGRGGQYRRVHVGSLQTT